MIAKTFVVISIVLMAIPLAAHHPFAAEFDWKKPVTMTGTVTRLEWMNPHSHVYIDIRDTDGRMKNWNFEMGGITALERLGWKMDSVKVGDSVTVDAWLSKSSDTMASMKSVKLPDGRELFGASSILDTGSMKHYKSSALTK